ncbi:hypothetical protein GCM10007421_18510 [Halopseudomonas oceani]|nr:hypothetical protein GCM10007421_18510 [Halopseudomonas oceani]
MPIFPNDPYGTPAARPFGFAALLGGIAKGGRASGPPWLAGKGEIVTSRAHIKEPNTPYPIRHPIVTLPCHHRAIPRPSAS